MNKSNIKKIFIFFIGGLFLFSCNSIKYIKQKERKVQVGWVDDNTYQFWTLGTWNKDKYYLNRYEEKDDGKLPNRFVNLKKIYSDLFLKKAIDYASYEFSKLIYRRNTDNSQKKWNKFVFSKLNSYSDISVFIVKEEFYSSGKVRFLLQIKRNKLRELIENEIPGG